MIHTTYLDPYGLDEEEDNYERDSNEDKHFNK